MKGVMATGVDFKLFSEPCFLKCFLPFLALLFKVQKCFVANDAEFRILILMLFGYHLLVNFIEFVELCSELDFQSLGGQVL